MAAMIRPRRGPSGGNWLTGPGGGSGRWPMIGRPIRFSVMLPPSLREQASGVLADALHHRRQPVAAVQAQVLVQPQLAEEAFDVEGQDVLRLLPRVDVFEQRDQPLHQG